MNKQRHRRETELQTTEIQLKATQVLRAKQTEFKKCLSLWCPAQTWFELHHTGLSQVGRVSGDVTATSLEADFGPNLEVVHLRRVSTRLGTLKVATETQISAAWFDSAWPMEKPQQKGLSWLSDSEPGVSRWLNFLLFLNVICSYWLSVMNNSFWKNQPQGYFSFFLREYSITCKEMYQSGLCFSLCLTV